MPAPGDIASRSSLTMPYRRSEAFAPPGNGVPDATFASGAAGPVHAVTGGTTHGMLYDSRRRCFYGKPLLRGWLHLALFHASLVTGTLLLIAVDGSLRTAAAAIYVATVSSLFGTSALYHRGRWTARQACLLQRLDHLMIFLLIAGTATPGFLIDLPGRAGLVGVGVLWALTLGAAVTHLAWMDAPERLVGSIFVALGCAAGAALPGVWLHSGPAAAVLMLGGGVLYLLGALAYHRRWPDPAPSIFGFHEVFHAFVGIAAACQYIAIALFIVRH
jgi:hemolysin III